MTSSCVVQAISLHPYSVRPKEYKYLLQQLAEVLYKELSQQQSKVIASPKLLNVALPNKEGYDEKKEAQ